MKTERRHELQHNVLADWLGEKIEAVKPYSRAVLGGLIALAVILGVYLYLSRQRATVAEDGWDSYFKAWERLRTDPDELSELAQSPTHRDTAAGMWARIALADYNYALGEDHLFSDRAQARQELSTARDNYSSVANQSEYPLLAQRALLGKARALESLDEQDEARKAYQTLADEADGLYQNEAKKRLADLSQDSTRQFYDWFALQDPRPRSQFAPGIPGVRPEFDFNSLKSDGSLFDRPPPDDSAGDLPLTPATGEPATGQPATGQPATGSAAEKEKSPAAAPDAGKKPADNRPTERAPAATGPKDGGK